MTEQQDTPFASDDPDVEGHGRVRASEDDVEGHRLRHGNALGSEDEDDVEGHRFKLGNTVQPQYDEDDVEGHRRV